MAPPSSAIDVRDLGIRYNLNLTRRATLKGSLAEWIGRKQQVGRHFWALRHVDFKIRHGDSVGILGSNGAGKSTLLLALAGILAPDEGSITVSGRVSSLLTLGAGFEITIRDLVEKIRRLPRFEGELVWDTSKPDGQPRRQLDVSRAEKLFGFKAQTGFDEGLKRTIEWFRSIDMSQYRPPTPNY